MGHVTFTGNATGRRYVGVAKNGVLTGAGLVRNVETPADALASCWDCFGIIGGLVATDYLELVARQDSGGNLTWIGGSETNACFSVVYLGS